MSRRSAHQRPIFSLRLTGSSRHSLRQKTFAFVGRFQRLERVFKAMIATATIGVLAVVVGCTSSGRYMVSWSEGRVRALARQAVGLPPRREDVEADWRRRRLYDMEQARGKLRGAFAQYDAPMRGLLAYAGLEPEHALLRWGNFDKALYLPSTIFEPDETGRSYRFRPHTRSIWLRNLKLKGGILAYFPVPDGPGLAEAVEGTGAMVVESSRQTTNSWGLRGPEPETSAPLRGIVLGDSYMQGLFVGDDQTPVECLKRELSRRRGEQVEVLNTGHLGYSQEQEYYTLLEYEPRIKPRFVVLSVFANDFGDLFRVLDGEGDWAEGGYWIGQIAQYCRTHQLHLLIVPAPWANQVDGARRAGNYPGRVSDQIEGTSYDYLDPIEEFTDESIARFVKAVRAGESVTPNPLFNGHLGDGHFSPLGCEVWARAVAERLSLLLARSDWERKRAP